MNKYELTTKKKKTSIIQSSLLLFNEKGFSDVSIKEISTYAKVSQASIYNYFGSKDALIAECAKIVMEDTFEKANEILNRDIEFHEKLKLALSLCNENINKSISEYFTKAALDDPVLVSLLVENINNEKTKIYLKYIELGKEQGAIDNTIPTDIYLKFINAINLMGDNIIKDLNTNIKYIHKFFLYGIIGK